MATITETGTFEPVLQLWETPMRQDNTPRGNPGQPIGRVTWFDTDVTAAKITTNVVELAIACNLPLRQFAYRLMNVNWRIQVTTADAIADIEDWNDGAFLTIPTADQTLTHNLVKPSSSLGATITNLFSSQEYLPGITNGSGVAMPNRYLSDPFLPLSPMIFRCVNVTANASAAMTWFSHMWAYVYTIEQYNQAPMWTSNVIGNG